MKATKLESNNVDLLFKYNVGFQRTKEQIQKSIEYEKEELERKRKHKELVKKRESIIKEFEYKVASLEDEIYGIIEEHFTEDEYLQNNNGLNTIQDEEGYCGKTYNTELFEFEYKEAILKARIDFLKKEEHALQCMIYDYNYMHDNEYYK